MADAEPVLRTGARLIITEGSYSDPELTVGTFAPRHGRLFTRASLDALH